MRAWASADTPPHTLSNMPRHKPAPPQAIALHKLPVQLRMLVRVMGEAAAYRLVEQRGGTAMRVPTRLDGSAGRKLAELVGAPAAATLVAELADHSLQLPKNDSLLRQLRHQRVIELRGQGLTQAAAARATGYTVRQVINILNRNGVAMPPEQDDLFPELMAPARAPATAAASHQAHNPFGLDPKIDR